MPKLRLLVLLFHSTAEWCIYSSPWESGAGVGEEVMWTRMWDSRQTSHQEVVARWYGKGSDLSLSCKLPFMLPCNAAFLDANDICWWYLQLQMLSTSVLMCSLHRDSYLSGRVKRIPSASYNFWKGKVYCMINVYADYCSKTQYIQ